MYIIVLLLACLACLDNARRVPVDADTFHRKLAGSMSGADRSLATLKQTMSTLPVIPDFAQGLHNMRGQAQRSASNCRIAKRTCTPPNRFAALLLAFNPARGVLPVSSPFRTSLHSRTAPREYCPECAGGMPSTSVSVVRRANRLATRHMSASMLALSGIDGLPEAAQAAVFLGYYLGLGVGTFWMMKLVDAIRESLPAIVGSTSAGAALYRRAVEALPLVGVLYLLAGISHFTQAEGFRAIYPPWGTWGFWYLPGSAEFHVAWTGVAECLGGSSLLVGSLLTQLEIEQEGFFGLPIGGLLTTGSALALFLLTLAITPSNIYMYTHGAIMIGSGPDAALDLSFHYIRFGFQVLLLSLLLTLARDSFFYAWGEQLD